MKNGDYDRLPDEESQVQHKNENRATYNQLHKRSYMK
jgi:hypothetical protein